MTTQALAQPADVSAVALTATYFNRFGEGPSMLGFDRRTAKITWTASLVLLALAAVYAVRSAVFVFVIAVFFSYLVHPLVEWIARFTPKRLSRGVNTGIVFLLVIAVLSGLATLAGPTLAEQGSRLVDQWSGWAGDARIADRLPLPGWLSPYRERIVAFVQARVAGGSEMMLPAAKQIGQGLLRASEMAVTLILVPILSFMFIKDAPSMSDRFLVWSDRSQHPTLWRGLMGDLDQLLGRYMRALVLLSLATMVCYSIAFSVAGVPFALVLAVFAGVFEFVPVAGPLAAAVLTLLVAALSGYPHLLGIAAFIAAYRIFQDYVLSPMLMSGGASVPPLLVLFGLLAGGELGGVAGVFLSVPILAAARLLAARIAVESHRVPSALTETTLPPKRTSGG